MSHPMRVRGLKHASSLTMPRALLVAPHAGAWIETEGAATCSKEPSVAPHAGAWIETKLSRKAEASASSHPMRVRGLKQCIALSMLQNRLVAPHAGAWIET